MAIATPDLVLTTPGTPIVIPVLANDAGNGLSIIGMTLPANGSMSVDPEVSVTYSPYAGFIGTDGFTYTIRDNAGATASATVSIDVREPNAAPLAADDEFSVQAGGEVTMPVIANDNDPDGDPMMLVALTLPANGTLEILPDQSLRYSPDTGFTGDETFTYTVCDGAGGQDQGSVLVHVLPANLAPEAFDDTVSVQAGSQVLIDTVANDNDPEGSALEIVGYSLPAHGSVSLADDGRFLYTPAEGFTGSDQFRYTIRDAGGLEDEAVVHVDVEAAQPDGFARAMWMGVPSTGITLDDLVLLVDETHADLRDIAHGGEIASADGSDIAFEALATAAELPREILHRNGQTGRTVAAVRIGTLPAEGDLRMRLLAGGSGMAPADDNCVWSGFLAAWAGTDGVNRAGDPALDLVPSGLAGGMDLPFGAAFDAAAHASHADGSFLNGLTEIEICAQVRSAATGVDARILAQGPHTGAQGAHGVLLTYDAIGYQGGAADVITAVIATDAGAVRIESGAGVQTTGIQHIALRWKSGSQIEMEIDGRPTVPSWVGTIVGGVVTADATLSGAIRLPAGSFELGGRSTDPWIGEIGLVTIRSTVAGSTRGLFDGRNRKDPHSSYGVSEMAALPVGDTPVVALPVSAIQAPGETIDHDVAMAFHDPDATPATLVAVGNASLAGACATLEAGRLRYTAGSVTGRDEVTFTLSDGVHQSTARLHLDVTTATATATTGGKAGNELPTPLRRVDVSSRSQLDAALASARPGDEIVLADGNYGSAPVTPTVSGTADHPVVIRAANRTGAWLSGIDFPQSSHDIHVHGIDLRDTNQTTLRGKRNQLVRCWLRPYYNPSTKKGSVCVIVHSGTATSYADACRIAYCNFELHRDEDVNGWATDNIHHCVRGKHDGVSDPWHKFLVIERFRVIGGPTRAVYSAPNGEHIETVESENASHEPIHWHITHFYGDDLPTRETIFDEKASGVTVCNGTCYGTSGKARIQNRQGAGSHFYNLNGKMHLDFYSGPGVKVHDCDINSAYKVRAFNGVVPWNKTGTNGAKQCKDLVIGNIGGGCRIEVGAQFSSNYVYKAEGTKVEGNLPSGGYVELNGATATRNNSPTNFTPMPNFLITPDEVGIDAPWVGLTTPVDP
ncbi:MAG: Ig-like domain-containing protein [Geminicoccaceae bacterium]